MIGCVGHRELVLGVDLADRADILAVRLSIGVIGGAGLSIELYLGQAGAFGCSPSSCRVSLQSEVNSTVAAGGHLLILGLFVYTVIAALL